MINDDNEMMIMKWWIEIIKLLSQSNNQSLSLVDIAKRTSFTIEDITETLKLLDLLRYVNKNNDDDDQWWRGGGEGDEGVIIHRYYNGQYILAVPQNLIDMMSKQVWRQWEIE